MSTDIILHVQLTGDVQTKENTSNETIEFSNSNFFSLMNYNSWFNELSCSDLFDYYSIEKPNYVLSFKYGDNSDSKVLLSTWMSAGLLKDLFFSNNDMIPLMISKEVSHRIDYDKIYYNDVKQALYVAFHSIKYFVNLSQEQRDKLYHSVSNRDTSAWRGILSSIFDQCYGEFEVVKHVPVRFLITEHCLAKLNAKNGVAHVRSLNGFHLIQRPIPSMKSDSNEPMMVEDVMKLVLGSAFETEQSSFKVFFQGTLIECGNSPMMKEPIEHLWRHSCSPSAWVVFAVTE
jgi:Autophagy protein Apg5